MVRRSSETPYSHERLIRTREPSAAFARKQIHLRMPVHRHPARIARKVIDGEENQPSTHGGRSGSFAGCNRDFAAPE